MKKVTVIIPNYNGLRFLPDCLDGLKAQTVKDFEILVVDNGEVVEQGTHRELMAAQGEAVAGEEDEGPADALLPDAGRGGGVPAPVRAEEIDHVPAGVVGDHAQEGQPPQVVQRRPAPHVPLLSRIASHRCPPRFDFSMGKGRLHRPSLSGF